MIWNILGIVIAIIVLVVLIFKGVHMIPASLIASLVAIVLGGINIAKGINKGYMASVSNYVQQFFLIFFLSALFGAVMSDSGAASKIAHTLVAKMGKSSVILIMLLTSLILSYGGIMTYLVAFTLFPVALVLFKEADIPIKLFPASVLSIAATISMTTLPGSPQIQNIMPTTYFHTTIYAAPIIGLVCGVFVFVVNYLYLSHAQKQASAKGEHFVPMSEEDAQVVDVDSDNMNFWLSLLPIIVMLALIFFLKGRMDSNYSVEIAMFVANVLTIAMFFKRFKHLGNTIDTGTKNAMNAILTTACVVGFGGVVAISPAFTELTKQLWQNDSHIYLTSMIVTSIAAGVSGSSSGGLGIWLTAMGNHLATMNLNFAALHRLGVMSSGWTGMVPWSSGPVVASSIAKVQLKDSYPYIFVTGMVVPFIALVIGYLMFRVGLV
ncbi:GntP family permease [Lacticaseibacillus baoqingensis]|uniref:GntP family permease n=1 Tax=Lacticaseibacillus baoqingensis TaxID=2486013 RepID=A0ABW4E5P5_9LACO|nr:GntP family permease [Lacticaseibacillus baoqingensis]